MALDKYLLDLILLTVAKTWGNMGRIPQGPIKSPFATVMGTGDLSSHVHFLPKKCKFLSI